MLFRTFQHKKSNSPPYKGTISSLPILHHKLNSSIFTPPNCPAIYFSLSRCLHTKHCTYPSCLFGSRQQIFHNDDHFNDPTKIPFERRPAGRGRRWLLGGTGKQLQILDAVASNRTQCKPGVDAAPSALIESGLLTQLKEDLGYKLFHDDTVHSYKELLPASDPDYRGMKNPLAVSAVTRKLSEQVYSHAKEGRMVLTLGGDHSIAIGTIAGTAKAIRERLDREMAVIWVDAHTDINTPETSDSGNVHGMPVAFLTGLAKDDREDIFGWLKKENLISLKKLVYIGLRDVDRGEKLILRENGVKAFSMHDIDRYVVLDL